MAVARVLLLAAFSQSCWADPRPGLLQGQGGDLPPDPGPPGWQPQAAAAPPAYAEPDHPFGYEAPPALMRSSLQAYSDRAPRVQVSRQAPESMMPHGDFQAFGGEDIARALTAQSIDESNKMIDQIERAQVAETKRSVYRALTRLRGAATAAYDGVAKTQMGNIDEYAVSNQFRSTHEITHLANAEGDVGTWAFPNSQGPRGPVSLTAHTTNTTKTGSDFWQSFFAGDRAQEEADGTNEQEVVKAIASVANPAAIPEAKVSAAKPLAKVSLAQKGTFWGHFFEEEGLPDQN